MTDKDLLDIYESIVTIELQTIVICRGHPKDLFDKMKLEIDFIKKVVNEEVNRRRDIP
jgi:hypothetical protein